MGSESLILGEVNSSLCYRIRYGSRRWRSMIEINSKKSQSSQLGLLLNILADLFNFLGSRYSM